MKRYKYCGKERDEETGLYYYGMRYYADWLCRFVSVDPLQFKYPYYTPYQYAGNRPITCIDLDGAEPFPNPFEQAVNELEGLWNYTIDRVKSLSPFKEKETEAPKVIQNTTEATKHYFSGDGEPVKLDQKFVQALMNTDKFKEKHERIVTGETSLDKGFFGIDMRNEKNAFFIGNTHVLYEVENLNDGNSVVTYTMFANDGFWDVDVIEIWLRENVPTWIYENPYAQEDAKGSNLELPFGEVYDFIPEVIQITFPTPVDDSKSDSKYDNSNRQY